MRVIAGEFRSRRLESVPGTDVRPTPDRLRESLFSILAPALDGVTFLDAYAGSGSVGIEALSRGARRCIFVERDSAAIEVLRKNLTALGITQRANVLRRKAAEALSEMQAEIVFLDPPYTHPEEYELALAALQQRSPKFVIAQHASRQAIKDEYGRLRRYRVLKQGDNTLSFFKSDEIP